MLKREGCWCRITTGNAWSFGSSHCIAAVPLFRLELKLLPDDLPDPVRRHPALESLPWRSMNR